MQLAACVLTNTEISKAVLCCILAVEQSELNGQYKYSMSKCTVLLLNLAVHITPAVFYRANYCVRCAEGGPSVGRVSNSSGWVELRRWFSKQLLNCQTIQTITDEMLKLTNLYAVTTYGRCHCFNVVVGLE